jgi:hypothetical protein
VADGGTGAGQLRPLIDGTLLERLRDILDSRGEPRLLFDLHQIRAEQQGFYLVLEMHGRRRPHRANDGRYYGRRGTSVRRMSEAEVEEAYYDRFVRQHRAMEPLLRVTDADELPPEVVERAHLGLKPDELALWREETGETQPPGWMSVVVFPDPLRPRLLDPVKDQHRFKGRIEIPTPWDPDQWPLEHFRLQPTQHGLYSQLPPRDDAAPSYLVGMHRSGVMEYGTTLEPGLRFEDPEQNRIIFTASHPQMAHDYLQAFAVALGELGHDGQVAARVSFENTRGVNLGLGPRDVAPFIHAIEDERVRGDLWRLSRQELLDQAGRIVKEVMDRVFLAAGLTNGTWQIDDAGNWVA